MRLLLCRKSLRQKLTDEGWRWAGRGLRRSFESMDGTERYLVEGQGLDAADGGDGLDAGGDGGEAGEGRGMRTQVRRERTRLEGRMRGSWDRATICVSSQVGCAVNCQFCLTAKLGLQRNLTAGEIAGQVVAVLDRHGVEVGKDRVNLVFMGMGEPFLNYDNFMAAVRLLVEEVGMSPQRMTVSTSGIVPGIERFAEEPAEVRPKLAISLNAPNDAIRSEMMPINRKWPIEAVMDAVRKVQLRPRERITFEYVLLGGVTDQAGACGGSGAAGAAHGAAGEGEPDCVESGAGDCVHDAGGRGGGGFQAGAGGGGGSGVSAPAAGAGYLCGVRAVEADGGKRCCALVSRGRFHAAAVRSLKD